MTYSCTDFADSIIDALGVNVPDESNDSPSDQADLCLAEIARLQSVIKLATPTQITVWVFTQSDAGDAADKATALVFGSKAEADKHWRKHAEELWVCAYGGDTSVTDMPEGDQELCEDLEAKGCMDWGEVEAQTITVNVAYDATLLAQAAEYVERFADLNGEPEGGDCRAVLAAIDTVARGRPLKATVEVYGGVAEVTECPAGVEVEIIDRDNEDAEDAEVAALSHADRNDFAGYLRHTSVDLGAHAMKIWIVSTCIPEPGEGPCFPNVFTSERAAESYADEMMRGEWEAAKPEAEDGAEPYPIDWREAQDRLVKWNGQTWGTWAITEHEIAVST